MAKLGRWVANLVKRLLATAALSVRIHPSLKKTGDISKGVANTHTLARPKKYKKEAGAYHIAVPFQSYQLIIKSYFIMITFV